MTVLGHVCVVSGTKRCVTIGGGVLDSMFLKAAQEQLWREWEVEAKGGG